MKLAITLFAVQLVNYCLLVINYRAIAAGHVGVMVGSDGLVALLGFFVIKRIAAEPNGALLAAAGYSLGGMVGSVLGLVISKLLH